MQTRLSEDSNRHSPQRWEGGDIIPIFASKAPKIAQRPIGLRRNGHSRSHGTLPSPNRAGHPNTTQTPWVREQYTAPAESPVRNAWAHTGAVTLPTVIER